MSTSTKRIEDLTVSDLEGSPVWQYTNSDRAGETAVKPVKKLPLKSLTGKIFGIQVKLHNGEVAWALISNVDATNARLTEHFLTLSLQTNSKWVTLARYHDPDYLENGPEALARYLERDVDEVFPISYDLTPYAVGEKASLSGQVLKQPRERLARSEIIALAVQ
jgi:hypothetical protein